MSSILDIIGSMLVGGLVMLMVVNMNSSYVQLQGNQNYMRLVQSNATVAASLIENDFRKIGYRCTDSMKILLMDTSKVKALGDFDDNGVIDTLTYYLDLSTSVYPSPNNNRIKMLYRVMNNQSPSPINLGSSLFRLWYFDSSEAQTTIRSKVRSLKVGFQFESPFKYQATAQYDTGYYSMYWERIIKPKNLK